MTRKLANRIPLTTAVEPSVIELIDAMAERAGVRRAAMARRILTEATSAPTALVEEASKGRQLRERLEQILAESA